MYAADQHVSVEAAEFESVSVDPELLIRNGRLDTYAWHHKRDYFAVQIGAEAVALQARGYVGVIPINDRLTLEVTPRVRLRNLARLLELSGEQATPLADVVRTYDTAGAVHPSLAALYAAALRQQIEGIAARGFYRDYVRREETTSFPHGRIDLHRTTGQLRSRGVKHRIAISHFQRSIDNPLNRCLLYAVWRLYYYLGQVSTVLGTGERRRAQRDLNVCRLRLQGVELDWGESFLSEPLVTGAMPLPSLRGYYRPALELALAIIGHQALAYETQGSRLELPSLVINMSSVFEGYARALLQEAAAVESWDYEVLDGNRKPPTGIASTLFEGEDDVEVRVTPDAVLRDRRNRQTPLIIEVKYRPPKDKPNREDLEQLLTYGLSYNANSLVLLQPQGSVTPAHNPEQIGTIAGMRVYRYIFDLGSDDLPAREQAFVSAIYSLL